MGNAGRPKLEIARDKSMTIRLTNFEFEKIARVAKKKNLTKTDAILKGIDLLERDKPKKFKNITGKNQKNSSANLAEEVVMFDK